MSTGLLPITGLPQAAGRPGRRAVDVLSAVLALVSMVVLYALLIWLVVGLTEEDRWTGRPDLDEVAENWGLHLASLAVLVLGLTTLTFHLFLQRGAAETRGERGWLITARATAAGAVWLALPLALARPWLFDYSTPGRWTSLAYTVSAALAGLTVLVFAVYLRRVPAERRFRAARLAAGVGMCALSLVTMLLSAILVPWPVPCCPF